MRRVLIKKKLRILLLHLCCYASVQAIAQAVPNMHKSVIIDDSRVRFDSLLEDIQQQTGFLFSIDTRRFPPGTTIRLQPGRYRIQKLLQFLHHEAGMGFRTVGNHIVVTDPPRTASLPAPGNTQQQLPVTTPLEEIRPPVLPKNSSPGISLQQIPVHYAVPQKDSVPSLADTVISGRKHYGSRPNPSATNKSNIQLPPMGGLYFGAGWNIDDFSFINFFAAAGYKRLHLAAGVTLKQQSQMVRLGAGTHIPLNDNTDLSAGILLSRLSGSFTTPDTIKNTKITVTGNWVQTNAGIVRQLTSRLSIHAGVTFNILFRRYYENDKMVAPKLEKEAFLHTYGLVSPLLNLHDSYDAQQATSTGIWIGFRAGIIYRIDFKRKKTLLDCPAVTTSNL